MRHAYATTCHPLRSSRARWCVWHMCMCMACARAHLEQRVPVAHALHVVDATLYSQHKPHLVRCRARARVRVRVRGRVASLHSQHKPHLVRVRARVRARVRVRVRVGVRVSLTVSRLGKKASQSEKPTSQATSSAPWG